jgi:hypothetical protein
MRRFAINEAARQERDGEPMPHGDPLGVTKGKLPKIPIGVVAGRWLGDPMSADAAPEKKMPLTKEQLIQWANDPRNAGKPEAAAIKKKFSPPAADGSLVEDALGATFFRGAAPDSSGPGPNASDDEAMDYAQRSFERAGQPGETQFIKHGIPRLMASLLAPATAGWQGAANVAGGMAARKLDGQRAVDPWAMGKDFLWGFVPTGLINRVAGAFENAGSVGGAAAMEGKSVASKVDEVVPSMSGMKNEPLADIAQAENSGSAAAAGAAHRSAARDEIIDALRNSAKEKAPPPEGLEDVVPQLDRSVGPSPEGVRPPENPAFDSPLMEQVLGPKDAQLQPFAPRPENPQISTLTGKPMHGVEPTVQSAMKSFGRRKPAPQQQSVEINMTDPAGQYPWAQNARGSFFATRGRAIEAGEANQVIRPPPGQADFQNIDALDVFGQAPPMQGSVLGQKIAGFLGRVGGGRLGEGLARRATAPTPMSTEAWNTYRYLQAAKEYAARNGADALTPELRSQLTDSPGQNIMTPENIATLRAWMSGDNDRGAK